MKKFASVAVFTLLLVFALVCTNAAPTTDGATPEGIRTFILKKNSYETFFKYVLSIC